MFNRDSISIKNNLSLGIRFREVGELYVLNDKIYVFNTIHSSLKLPKYVLSYVSTLIKQPDGIIVMSFALNPNADFIFVDKNINGLRKLNKKEKSQLLFHLKNDTYKAKRIISVLKGIIFSKQSYSLNWILDDSNKNWIDYLIF